MKFYTQQHRYYRGIDLHARTMYLCILNQGGEESRMTERVTSGLRRRGAGDGFTVRLVRHRQTKGTETDRSHL